MLPLTCEVRRVARRTGRELRSADSGDNPLCPSVL